MRRREAEDRAVQRELVALIAPHLARPKGRPPGKLLLGYRVHASAIQLSRRLLEIADWGNEQRVRVENDRAPREDLLSRYDALLAGVRRVQQGLESIIDSSNDWAPPETSLFVRPV
jgi:hypothetical protein